MIFDARFDDKHHTVKVIEDKQGGYLITIDSGDPFHVDVIDKLAGGYSLLHKSQSFEFDVESKDHQFNVISRGQFYSVELMDQKLGDLKGKEFGEKKLVARMPGKIIKVMVKAGDTVTKGQGLVIMEAMKMENELKSPVSGKIKSIKVQEGKTVDAGTELILLE